MTIILLFFALSFCDNPEVVKSHILVFSLFLGLAYDIAILRWLWR